MKSYQDKLKESWEILSNNKGIRETWPDEKELTLLDFADQCKDETLRNNKEELEQCHRTGKLNLVPTLAICGGIEAGKSSIIASFLTDENQERVLMGGGMENGTHRITVWLPSEWEEKRELANKLLKETFGCEPEFLLENGKEAKDQQQKHKSIETPLIAFDDNLNELGIALIDCPDRERMELDGAETNGEDIRDRVLKKISKMACGLVLVIKESDIETSNLDWLLTELTTSIKIFVVNRTETDSSPSKIISDLEDSHSKHGIKSDKNCFFYLDYHFEIERVSDKRPEWASSGLPSPFLVEAEPEKNKRLNIGEERSLQLIQETVSPEKLISENGKRQWQTFQKVCSDSFNVILEIIQKNNRLTKGFSEALEKESKAHFFDNEGNPKFQFDEKTMLRIKNFMVENAPWFIKGLIWPLLKIQQAWKNTFDVAKKAVADEIKKAVPFCPDGLKTINEKIPTEYQQRLKKHLKLVSEILSDAFDEFRKKNEIEDLRKKIDLEETGKRIASRFLEESPLDVDDETLRKLAKDIWKKCSWKVIGKNIAAIICIAVTLFLIPLDGGILFISFTELLAGTAAGMILLPILSSPDYKRAFKQANSHQQADFLAICEDQLGLPRSSHEDLPESILDEKTYHKGLCQTMGWKRYETIAETEAELRKIIS